MEEADHVRLRRVMPSSTNAETATRWICESCGYVYDPERGDPDGGIPPGPAFEDIPITGPVPCVERASAISSRWSERRPEVRKDEYDLPNDPLRAPSADRRDRPRPAVA